MKGKVFKVLLTFILVIAVLLSVACSSANKGNETSTAGSQETNQVEKKEVKISWLESQANYKDIFKDMAAQLQKDENISVDFQVIPDDQYYNLCKAKLATSEVPDIIGYNTPQCNVELNAHTTCVDLSNEPWVARLSNKDFLLDSIDGKIYALPRESSSFFGPVYYNRKVFKDLGISEEQPTTYKAFLDVLEQIKTAGKDKGIIPIHIGTKDSWTMQIFTTLGFAVALYPNDKATWEKLLTNKMKWTEVPEFQEVLADYQFILKNYVNSDLLSANYEMTKEAVATGKAAMLINGEWTAADIMAKWPDTDLGAWILPYKDNMIMGTGAFVHGLFVPKAGKQVEETKRFLDLWSQPKYQDIYFEKFPGFPGFKDVNGGKVIPCVKALVDNYIITGKYTIEMNGNLGVAVPLNPEFWAFLVEMAAGGKTPKQVMEAYDKKFSDFMKTQKQPGF